MQQKSMIPLILLTLRRSVVVLSFTRDVVDFSRSEMDENCGRELFKNVNFFRHLSLYDSK